MTHTSATVIAGLLAAASIGLAACGSDTPPDVPYPSNSATNQAAPAPGGTTPEQIFGAACSQLPQGGLPGSALRMQSVPVVTGLSDNPFADTFETAVRHAGLADAFNAAPAETVFVPYDAAWANLQDTIGPDKYKQLLGDQKQLSEVLKSNVVPQRYDRAGLAAAREVVTLQGVHLTVSDDGETLSVKSAGGRGSAHVLCGNVPTANATVFLVDKVLTPSAP